MTQVERITLIHKIYPWHEFSQKIKNPTFFPNSRWVNLGGSLLDYYIIKLQINWGIIILSNY